MGCCRQQGGVTRVQREPVSSSDTGSEGHRRYEISARPASADTPELTTSRSRGGPLGPRDQLNPLKRGRLLQQTVRLFRHDPSMCDHLKRAAAAEASARPVSEQPRDPSGLERDEQWVPRAGSDGTEASSPLCARRLTWRLTPFRCLVCRVACLVFCSGCRGRSQVNHVAKCP